MYIEQKLQKIVQKLKKQQAKQINKCIGKKLNN